MLLLKRWRFERLVHLFQVLQYTMLMVYESGCTLTVDFNILIKRLEHKDIWK